VHTNYYFLRQLAPALKPHLIGLRLMECYSQDRDELVLVFAQAKGKTNYYRPFYIKTTLRPEFSGLLFPESVQRARTNSVDLFGSVIGVDPDDAEAIAEGETAGRVVTGVRSFLNERCLGIELEDGYTLVFKFFGNRPNLLAFQGNEVVDTFNQKLVADQNIKLDAIDRPIDQSYEAFERAGFDHKKLFPTFGKEVNAYLKSPLTPEGGTAGASPKRPLAETLAPAVPPSGVRGLWAEIQSVLSLLENPTYYLTTFNHHPTLSLVPIGEIRQTFDDPIEATNRFYVNYAGLNFFEREKGEVLRLLDKRLKRAESQIEASLQRLISHDEGASNEEIANILMANLHAIEEVPGQRSPERVELYDFYRDQPIQIKLKPDLTPQKNAEGYYRKSKNEKIELDFIQQQIEQRERDMVDIQQHKTAIAEIASLKAFRKYAKQHNLLADGGPAATAADLFKMVNHEGFTILIGRNAKNNDLLTQRYAFKDDLWLHARDVSGSHVVIKYQAGKRFPKTVIERAAELAAWNSKRRTDSLCPVIMTPKKFVRKPKGLAEGQVVVEKEEVIMVVPKG
jgi:predicted ribosome quality control (RQC) complex YloA/Tae2 family protein